MTTKNGAYGVIKSVLVALDRKGFPPPDEKLKQIVGSQIAHLLKGGYDLDRITHLAVELALSWDNAKGHQRLLGLRQRVLQDDTDTQAEAHEQRKRDLSGPPDDPAIRAAMVTALRTAKAALRLPMCGSCRVLPATDTRGLCDHCRRERVLDLESRQVKR